MKTSRSKLPRSRVVWVTGASSGIGKSLADVFASNGDIVIATARTTKALRSLKRGITAFEGTCEIYACDVRSERSVTNVARMILKKYRGVDVLVNNAGVTYFKDFSSTRIKEFDEVIETNLRGAFTATKMILPAMMRKKSGIVVNIISYAAKTVYANSAAYSASKSGLEALMNVLRSEIRGSGIKIVNVYPGAVLTTMWLKSHRRKYADQMMLPEDVARVIYETTTQSPSVMVEELVIRPQGGDLQV